MGGTSRVFYTAAVTNVTRGFGGDYVTVVSFAMKRYLGLDIVSEQENTQFKAQ